MGILLLEGGAEFGGLMSEPDLRAIELAGGREASIAILPTAAAPDHNNERAGRNGQRWFELLGATHVDVVPVIDKSSASDPALAARIRVACLIYMLGGFPGYLAKTLAGSPAWQAALDAFADGAVLGGSSAGAMVLCQHLYDPEGGSATQGLDLVPNVCLLPHHNQFGKSWAGRLGGALPQAVLVGIDEQTGMLNDASGAWTVYGGGKVTVYRSGKTEVHGRGETFQIPP